MISFSKSALSTASAVLLAGLCSSAMAAEVTTLQTFAAPDGETYFAVGVMSERAPRSEASQQHVILFDTSASQIGAHRRHALSVLESFLVALPEADRVSLFAVDVKPVRLSESGVSPQAARQTAVRALKQRFPAGSTDMQAALSAALQEIDGGSITYIGDGMSTANLLQQDDARALLDDLVQRQIPVHTYAVGPNKDRQLLGILSHHTGGAAMSDEGADESQAGQIGSELALASRLAVEYPSEMPFAHSRASVVPDSPLPLRTDRETIYLGRGSVPVAAEGAVVNDKGNTFLHGFYRQAVREGGLNPLAGMTAFRDAQQGFEDEIARLEDAGQRAIAAGQLEQAEQIGLTLKNFDPQNVRAEAIIGRSADLQVRMVAQANENPFAQPQDQAPAAPEGPAAPPADPVPPSQLLNSAGGLSAREGQLPASLIEQQEIREQVLTERMVTQINSVLQGARQRVSANPAGVLADLEAAMGAVKAATEIDPEVRAMLLRRVNDTILEVQSRREALNAIQLRAQQRQAEQEAQRRLIDSMILDELRLTQLVDRVRALMYEGFQGNPAAFEEAEAVARQVESMEPGAAIGTQLVLTTEAAGQLDKMYRLRSLRADRFLATLYQVELSHVPFPDEPPVRYPPAPVWRALTERRAKWASVDLHQNSPNEQRIYNELDKETSLEFVDTPLSDAIDFIASLHTITILIDETALTDVGIPTDEPVNLILNGVKLRSALKIMLEGLGLTWVVEDEVMKITTSEIAEEKMQTRVYPVGDLVISPTVQLQNVGQAGGGALGGGGGLGGGGQGGLGGGGGGLGGGGGGFGGGFGSISDDVATQLGKKKPATAN
jgi:hypothetical protein